MVKNYDDMLSRFHLVPERNGQTDRQICFINIARQYADARYKKTETSLVIWLNIVTIVARSVRLFPRTCAKMSTPFVNCIVNDGRVSVQQIIRCVSKNRTATIGPII